MAKFRIFVETDDGDDDTVYMLDKTFRSRKSAEAELDDILSGEPSYLGDGMIISGSVEEED